MGKNRSSRSYQGRPSVCPAFSSYTDYASPSSWPEATRSTHHRNRVCQSRILAILNTPQGQILGWYF